jgi:hypothetical protein
MIRRILATLLTVPALAIASYAAAALMTVNTVLPDAPTKPPQFEVDPAWPKPLPNRWLMGQAAGVSVDRHDHIWDADLSPDTAQAFIHTADGENNVVWNLLRDTGRVLGSFGRHGRSAGQFHWIHNLAVDSKGNVYTTEVDSGKRAQKFVNKGS